MKTKLVGSTLQEDLDALGVKGLNEGDMAAMVMGSPLGAPLAEQKPPKCEPEDEEGEEDEEDEGEDYEESKHDPIDGPFVTDALFDRIMALPLDSLSEEEIGAVIEGLKEKKIPRNVAGIEERAEQVATALLEKMKAIVWKGKRKRVKIDTSPEAKKKRRERRMEYRKKKAVIGRKRAKWSRKVSAKRAAAKTAAAHQRMGDSESFAVELEHLLDEQADRVANVRDEILTRIENIVELIEDEFDDDAVDSVFEAALQPLAASYEAGRLDEDVMDVDAFLAEIRPVTALISKSLDRLDRGGLGNG